MTKAATLESEPKSQKTKPSYIKWFHEIGIEDVPIVGGKTASLGEMFRELTPKGVEVPDGFAITAAGYWHVLRETRLDQFIGAQLLDLDANDVKELQKRGAAIRDAILAAKLPTDLRREILEAYDQLCRDSDEPISVAVRSSATAEDLPEASFAGAQETFLNVTGHDRVIEACRRCYASLFTDRAISYRAERGFAHDKVGLSIAVQTMVHSDVGSSGVIFTIDTETGFRDAVLINASYGLGENVVKGFVNPDEFCVFKPTLKTGFRPILQKVAGSKELKLVYDTAAAGGTRNIPVPPQDRRRFSISDDEILQLARWACIIEEHYSAKKGRPTPMDVEFAKDGRTGELFILQARPETVESRKDTTVMEHYRLKSRGSVLIQGRSVGTKIAAGAVRVIADPKHLDDFQEGEILVADKTDPDWEPIMKKAAAIVTNRGGRTCHAAIVSRELGVPAIVGTEHATELLARRTDRHGFVRGRRHRFRLRRQTAVRSGAHKFERPAAPAHESHDERGQSGRGISPFLHSKRRRRSRARGIHHQQLHQSASAGADRLREDRQCGSQNEHRRVNGRLRRQTAVLRGQTRARRRHDRRCVLSQGCDRAAERFQNKRIREPDRRPRLRAGGGKSDARFPRRVALLQPAISGRLCPRMPRDEKSARRNGPDECETDGPVLPHSRRRPQSHRRNGRSTACGAAKTAWRFT